MTVKFINKPQIKPKYISNFGSNLAIFHFLAEKRSALWGVLAIEFWAENFRVVILGQMEWEKPLAGNFHNKSPILNNPNIHDK